MQYWVKPTVPREGNFYLYVVVKNVGLFILQSPVSIQAPNTVPSLDPTGQPPQLILSLVGPSSVNPGQTVTLTYKAYASWNFAAPPTFWNSLLNSYEQLGINVVSMVYLEREKKQAYENFVLQHFFTKNGQTMLEYWIIKRGNRSKRPRSQ